MRGILPLDAAVNGYGQKLLDNCPYPQLTCDTTTHVNFGGAQCKI